MGQRMSWRDLVASILIMMLIATYAVFLIGGGLPFAVDNGDMAALSLGLEHAKWVVTARGGPKRKTQPAPQAQEAS